jgi:hypothetical protein
MPVGYVHSQSARDEAHYWTRHLRNQPRPDSGGYSGYCPTVPHELRRFELKTNLTPSVGYATAYLLNWEDGDLAIDEDVTFTVYDTTLCRRARGKDNVAEGQDGARGICYMPHDGFQDAEAWEILECRELALTCRAQLTADLESVGETCTVDHILPDADRQSPVNDETTATLSDVSNLFGFKSDEDANVMIARDSDGGWYLVQAECSQR